MAIVTWDPLREMEEKGNKCHKVERYFGVFTRSFSLPENVDETKIAATFKDGMLNLEIPKTAMAKPRQIEVKVK